MTRGGRLLAAHIARAYVGRPHVRAVMLGGPVAALAADAGVMRRTGQLISSRALAREQGFTDLGGWHPQEDRLR